MTTERQSAYGARPIASWRRVCQGTEESGNLQTVCGEPVTGWMQLADGEEITCPECLALTNEEEQ